MDNASIYSQIRKAVLAELRRVAPATQYNAAGGRQTLSTVGIVRQIAQAHPGWPASDVWLAVQELIVQGVLLIGDAYLIAQPFTDTAGDGRSLPHVAVSRYGIEFLASLKDQPDPYDAISLLEPLRKLSIANDTVEAYIPEAVKALQASAYRGACILIGVAAEALAEEMYEAFARHLDASKRASFEQAMGKKLMSAEARWEEFTKRFPGDHQGCVGDELARRVSNVLEPMWKLFKQNRDDAAHRRAALIDRETSTAAVAMIVPFAKTAADVLAALSHRCIAGNRTAQTT